MKTLIAIVVLMMSLVLQTQQPGGHMEFYGLSQEEYKLWAASLRDRKPRPIPTYTVLIKSDDGEKLKVFIEGSYSRPDGKEVIIERHEIETPISFYVNADCRFKLKISTEVEGRKFTAITLYEYKKIVRWIATARGENAQIDYPPYQEK